MNLSIGPHWEKFVEDAVNDGRFGSPSDVVREGLRLVEKREAKLKALQAAIREGVESDDVDEGHVQAAVAARLRELREKGK